MPMSQKHNPMNILILFLLSLNVFLSFIASPAPESLELTDLALVSLTCLIALLSISVTSATLIGKNEGRLLTAVLLYLGYLVLSAFMGLLHGVPLLSVARSAGPYLVFFPLVFAGFLPANRLNPWTMALILIGVGLTQTVWLAWLYVSHVPAAETTQGILINRITFMDQRTTLPLLLSVPILSLMFLDGWKGRGLSSPQRVTMIVLVLIGLFAGMVTLTRAIFLSMVTGWSVFAIVWCSLGSNTFSVKKSTLWIFSVMGIVFLLSLIPAIHRLETGLFARFTLHTANGPVDYSNGRIYDEWLPALTAWLSSGPLSFLFGMGAGMSFTVLSGEERTYIHNLSIYSLVYGGLFGFLSCLWLYFCLFRTFYIRARQTPGALYPALIALLASLYFYGQLFAVHKGLAYNEMLFLMIALALIRPDTALDTVPGTAGNS